MSAAASLEKFKDGVSRLEHLLSGVRRGPNFFRITPRVFRVEGVHSDLLAWLLDPQGFHGLGDSFAVRFMADVLLESGVSVDPRITITSIDVEASTGEGPIDILVRAESAGTSLVVGIENKIDAPLGNKQLEKYARGLVARFPDTRVVLVLLAPTAREVDEPSVCCEFACLTYRNVVACLTASLSDSEAENAGAGRELAGHYLEELRTKIVPESRPEIDQILRELAGHKEAWRLIRRRLPSERDDSHAALARAVCGWLSKPNVCGPPWRFALRRDGYARVFRPGWTALGDRDSDTVVGLTDDEYAATRYPCVHFRLAAAPPDDDAGDRWRYMVKLRVDARSDDALGASIRRDLDARGLLRPEDRDRQQLTPVLKQSQKLPALAADSVSDRLVEWFVGQIQPIVGILDGHLSQG
jgi:PD-(D/E)XK nuclease superfamily protein